MEALKELDIEIEETQEEMRLLQGKLEHLLFKRRKMQRKLNLSDADKKQSLLAVLPDKLTLIGKEKISVSNKVDHSSGGQVMSHSTNQEEYPRVNKENPEKKGFTVIFTMPYEGIYSNESEIQRIITGNPSIKYKKFRSGIEAEASLAMHRSQFGKTPFDKETFAKVIENKPKEKSNLIPIGVKFRINTDYPEKGVSFEQWKTFANIIRKDDGSKYLDNKYFSTDNGYLSKFNLIAGINPKLCYQLFLSGLIDNIYPSRDLSELEFFPYGFKKTVENYQKRALKNSDREIFLSVQSSLPWWENDELHSPYCFVRLGTKNRNQAFKEPVALEEFRFTEEHLEDLRAEGLFRIYQDTLTISPSKEMRINYKTSKVLIASYFNKKMSDDDFKKFRAYKNYFLTNTLDADEATKIKFCEKIRKGGSMDHMCQLCIQPSINLPTVAEMESHTDPCED